MFHTKTPLKRRMVTVYQNLSQFVVETQNFSFFFWLEIYAEIYDKIKYQTFIKTYL